MAEIDKITPMMKQYMSVKQETPSDSLLMFRLGDFYEMFFDDAIKAAPILDVVLTKRAGYPMCGVPYHALDAYLPKLLDAGMKVAIAEQMEDPKLAKNIVKREITRILTPGSILDSSCLKPGQNNFLCSLYSAQKNQYGFAWLDVSTGEFMTEELNSIGELESEIQRLQPKECIVSSSLHELWTKEKSFPFCCKSILWTPVEDWCFGLENTEDLLLRQFHVMSLDGFGLRGCPSAVRAAGAVLHYASENLRHSTGHIQTIRRNFYGDYLSLDPICQRNLELTESLHGAAKAGTLLELLDAASTAMGSRLMRDWILKPLRDVKKIQERQDVVALFLDDAAALAEIRESLQMIRDIERLISKLNVGAVNARDMIALGNSLSVLPGIRSVLADFDMPYLNRLHDDISEFSELTERISKTISDDPPAVLTEGGIIRTGFNADLDELRSAATDGRKWVAELQAKEIERTGIKSLKVHYNKVFGYYIEVSNSNLEHVPEDYIRKQTLTNGERFITPELKEFESKILGAEDKSKAMEQTLFEELRQYAEGFTQKIQLSAKAVSELDVLCALQDCASQRHYIRPHISDGDELKIIGGRHPVLETKMEGERFVPNDTVLDGNENRMMIITGPNMAGKSTYIRQTALLVIMAQMGSFIPADDAWIGVADRIFTRVGAMDDISRGQSTFMVEMVETSNILNHATSKSLVILDEIGRGTSTFDGLSIAWAVAEYLLDNPKCRARTQFATHYHELTALALTRQGVKNYNVAVREYGDQVIFLRQIIPGAADKSYGIHVAKLAGLPAEVISRAQEILESLEGEKKSAEKISSTGAAGSPLSERPEKYSVEHSDGQPLCRKKKKAEPDETDSSLQPFLF